MGCHSARIHTGTQPLQARIIGGYVNLDSWQWFWLGFAAGWTAFGAIGVWMQATAK